MRRVLPGRALVQLDATHPIFHSFFEINSLDDVQGYYGDRPTFHGIFEDNDPTKRLLRSPTTTTISASTGSSPTPGYVPVDLSNEAYKFGVNYVIYAMTH